MMAGWEGDTPHFNEGLETWMDSSKGDPKR